MKQVRYKSTIATLVQVFSTLDNILSKSNRKPFFRREKNLNFGGNKMQTCEDEESMFNYSQNKCLDVTLDNLPSFLSSKIEISKLKKVKEKRVGSKLKESSKFKNKPKKRVGTPLSTYWGHFEA